MVGALNRRTFLYAAGAAFICPSLGAALAQSTLSDPTRPPPLLEASAAADAKVSVGAAAAAGLQTIIRRPGRKPVAVINGEAVELGGKVGAARLVRLGDNEAVLQGPEGKEVLRLTPNVRRKLFGGHDGSATTERKP